jgi:hypothetical protein
MACVVRALPEIVFRLVTGLALLASDKLGRDVGCPLLRLGLPMAELHHGQRDRQHDDDGGGKACEFPA